MISRSKPAFKELKSANEIDKALSKDDVTIICFGDAKKHATFLENFKEACS